MGVAITRLLCGSAAGRGGPGLVGAEGAAELMLVRTKLFGAGFFQGRPHNGRFVATAIDRYFDGAG